METSPGIIKQLAERTVIITTTWYNPDKEIEILRSRLALSAVKAATELGYAQIILDSGSSDEFLREVEQHGQKVISDKPKTIGIGRRMVISEALKTDKKYIAWTEPEKVTYVPEIYKTLLPLAEQSADLVVPKRRSLESYPLLQQHAESFGNGFWKELTGTSLDVWFGPRTWRREMSNYFLNYQGEYGDKWDCIYIPVLDAVLDRKKVVSTEVDYVNPKDQTESEEHNLTYHLKRLDQLENLVKTIALHWEKRTEKNIVPWQNSRS